VEYVHFPTLGIPSAWRADLDDTASYERLLARYDREFLPAQTASVAQVARLVEERPSALDVYGGRPPLLLPQPFG